MGYKWIYHLSSLTWLTSYILCVRKETHSPLRQPLSNLPDQTPDSSADGAELLFGVVTSVVVLGPSWCVWSSVSLMDKERFSLSCHWSAASKNNTACVRKHLDTFWRHLEARMSSCQYRNDICHFSAGGVASLKYGPDLCFNLKNNQTLGTNKKQIIYFY